MIRAKLGVSWDGVRAETLEAIAVAERIYHAHGLPCVVTSLVEGRHKTYSLHYRGLAVDLRLPMHPDYGLDIAQSAPLTETIFDELKAALFPDYDVIREPSHYHVEYDPKTEKQVRVS